MNPHKHIKALAAAFAVCLFLQTAPLNVWADELASEKSTTPMNVNLLKNPGFEQGTDGWNMPADNVVKTPVHSGENAAYHKREGVGKDVVFSQTLSNMQAGVYELSGYVNSSSKKYFLFTYGGSLNVDFWPNYTADGSYLKPVTTGNQGETNGWKKVFVEFTLPFDGASVTVHGDVTAAIFEGYTASCAFDGLSLKRIRAVTPEPMENLLRNPGFEQAAQAWTPVDLPSAFTTNDQHLGGQSSLYLGYFTAEPMVKYMEQTHFNSGDGVYMFTGFVQTAPGFTGMGAVFRLEAKDATGAVLASQATTPVADTSGKWQRVTMTLYAPAETKDVTLNIGGEQCVGGFYVDDLVLNHAPRR